MTIFTRKLTDLLTNFPLMDKPGSWFLLAKCLKHLWKSDILSKDAGHRQVITWNSSHTQPIP